MALIMQCVSLFLQFLWATGLLLASNLALAVRHLHLKQISCGNLTDYFSHFRFPWSWSLFSTCSSGTSAPCMVRPLWLVADFISGPLSYFELLSGQSLASIASASSSETDFSGNLKTDYFPHFSNFLVLWTPFTTCSSGLSVPFMARLLGLSVVLTRASVPSLQS